MAMRSDGAPFFESVDVGRTFQFFRRLPGTHWLDRNHALTVVGKFNLFADTLKVNRAQKIRQFDSRKYLRDLLLPFGLLRLPAFHCPADLFYFNQPAPGNPINTFSEQILSRQCPNY